MKDRATATLRFGTSGEVVGEILNEHGTLVASKRFGVMTEDECRKGLQELDKYFSKAASTDSHRTVEN